MVTTKAKKTQQQQQQQQQQLTILDASGDMDGLECVLCESKNKEGEQILHRLPSAEFVRERWISFIQTNLGDKWTSKNKAVNVCSNHFAPSDFVMGFSEYLLGSDATPSAILQKLVEQPESTEEILGKDVRCEFLQADAMESKIKEVDNVRFESATVHPLKFNGEVELVHIFVEKSTELVMNTLYSSKDVDTFIKSDKTKILPRIIHNYESNICRLKLQQQPLSKTEQIQMANMKKELGVLRQKLFQWALLTIEENLTITSSDDQQVTNFDKAEFLIFKSTEQLRRRRDANSVKLKMMETDLKKMEQQRDMALAELMELKNQKLSEVPENRGESAEALVASLQLQLQQVKRKEKQILANYANRKVHMAQSANVIQELRRKNRQFLEQQAIWKKASAEKDKKIIDMHKSLEESEIKLKQLHKELEAISGNLQVRSEDESQDSLTEQLDEHGSSSSNTNSSLRKRKISSSTSEDESDSEDCTEVIDIEKQVLDKRKVQKPNSSRADKVQLIQVD